MITDELQVRLIKGALIVGLCIITHGCAYYMGSRKAGEKCVQASADTVVKELTQARKQDQATAVQAVKRADQVSKELSQIKDKQNEEAVNTGCPLTATNGLLSLQALASRTKPKP